MLICSHTDWQYFCKRETWSLQQRRKSDLTWRCFVPYVFHQSRVSSKLNQFIAIILLSKATVRKGVKYGTMSSAQTFSLPWERYCWRRYYDSRNLYNVSYRCINTCIVGKCSRNFNKWFTIIKGICVVGTPNLPARAKVQRVKCCNGVQYECWEKETKQAALKFWHPDISLQPQS